MNVFTTELRRGGGEGVWGSYRGLLVDGLDDELLVVEGDVSDLAPGEADFWRQPGQRKEFFFNT